MWRFREATALVLRDMPMSADEGRCREGAGKYAGPRRSQFWAGVGSDGHADGVPTEAAARVAWLTAADKRHLTASEELALIKVLAGWPRLIESAAESHEPHRVAFYLGDLAAAFHGLWNRGRDDARLRFIVDDAPELTRARLALVRAAQSVIATGLRLIGVEPVEEM